MSRLPASLGVSAASTLVAFVGIGIALPQDLLAAACCVTGGLIGNIAALQLQARERRRGGIPPEWRRVARLDVMYDEDHQVVCIYNANGRMFPVLDQAATLALMAERLQKGEAPDGILPR